MVGEKIFSEIARNPLGAATRKGRNNSLIAKRNDCLIARYYYYGYYKNKCYEDTIRALVAEFFLSPATIIAIVQNNTDVLLDIKQRCPAIHYLQHHWPHMKW